MATIKNITIKQYNGTDYDTLLPKASDHASTHAIDGVDALSATDIGALSLSSGGTVAGSTTFSQPVNLNNSVSLASYGYGTALPSTGTTGQIFFVIQGV